MKRKKYCEEYLRIDEMKIQVDLEKKKIFFFQFLLWFLFSTSPPSIGARIVFQFMYVKAKAYITIITKTREYNAALFQSFSKI